MSFEKWVAITKIVFATAILIVMIALVMNGQIQPEDFFKWATGLLGLLQALDGARLLTRPNTPGQG